MKPTLISGIQPTGPLHIGNYLGALRNFVILQNTEKYECFFFVADHHSLTEYKSRAEEKKNIQSLMLDFLAAGLDPKKSTLLIQSYIPEHTELAWILSSITPMGELERMTQYKDKVGRGMIANVGLFTYPVLMAADILMYKAEAVPVGDDQDQHLEFTRTLARAWNKKFGRTFPEPKPAHARTPRIMSLDNPTRKMSKSAQKGCLFLSDSPQTVKEKIKSAVTDSESVIRYDPKNRPGMANLIMMYSELTGATPEETAAQFKTARYTEFKTALGEQVIKTLAPLREKRKALLKEKDAVAQIFAEGSQKAEERARKTLEEVKRKLGLG